MIRTSSFCIEFLFIQITMLYTESSYIKKNNVTSDIISEVTHCSLHS